MKDAHRRAKIIMAAMIAGLGVFVIVVEVLKRSSSIPEQPPEGSEIMRIIFYFAAIAMVFVVNVFQGFTLKGVRSEHIGFLATKLMTVTIVTAGLAEMPIILGLILFVICGYHLDFYVLGFVSLYLMVRHFPYYRQWEKYVMNRMGQNWPAGPVSG